MWGIPVSFQCGIGIFRFLPLMASGPVGFPIRIYGGHAVCKRRGLGCGGKHTAAFRDLCQIGYSVSFPPATFALWHISLRIRYRKNIPEPEAARLQTKGKRLELQKSSVMAIELIDRKESASYKGGIYELTLLWDRESIRKCFCGMPPFFAHIRKDGANFASIDCYSNDNGRFAVKMFMPSLLARSDWQVRFDKDINTIPLLELLAGLPI